MSTPTLLGVCGSLRQGSFNRKLMYVAAGSHGGAFSEGGSRLPLYDGDLEAAEGAPTAAVTLADQIIAADAVVISTPAYNKNLPGVLKNAFDWLSRTKKNPLMGKPVAIPPAAAGRAGGAGVNGWCQRGT